MVKVYAIRSDAHGRIYVGMTTDLEKRIKQHNSGYTKSTKFYCPWILIYEEDSINYEEGRKREKILKSGKGKEFLKSLGNLSPKFNACLPQAGIE